MKTYRILPAAFAAALIAAGGASHAWAGAIYRDDGSAPTGPELQMGQYTIPDLAISWTTPSKGALTMSDALKKAENRVGDGKVIAAERYGIGNDMYKFDIQTNGIMKRVFVNGETGGVQIAASLDPGLDPTVVGDPGNNDNDDHHNS